LPLIHTFCWAMAAMHHSRIELTMNYYTDPVLLDIAGAVESLPDFTGSTKTQSGRQAGRGQRVRRREAFSLITVKRLAGILSPALLRERN